MSIALCIVEDSKQSCIQVRTVEDSKRVCQSHIILTLRVSRLTQSMYTSPPSAKPTMGCPLNWCELQTPVFFSMACYLSPYRLCRSAAKEATTRRLFPNNHTLIGSNSILIIDETLQMTELKGRTTTVGVHGAVFVCHFWSDDELLTFSMKGKQ